MPLLVVAGAALLVWMLAPGSGSAALVVLEVSVASGSDDVEENPSGSMYIDSSDLELVTDGSMIQTIGLRFTGVGIPAGSAIAAAWLQFQVDETSSGTTNLAVQGQATDAAAPFTTAGFNVSSRARTTASVAWTPPAWTSVGQAGAAQRTPDLSAPVQEIVGRPGWAAGNALVLIITGTGKRVAESFEGAQDPRLHVEYTALDGSPAPSPSASSTAPAPDPSASATVTPSTSPTATPSTSPTATPSTSPTATASPTLPPGRIWRVPGDASSVQGGINLAANGDTVLVAPGTYRGSVTINAKAVTLASHFLTTGDQSYVAQTILDGGGSPPLVIPSASGPAPTITGFTIQGGSDGVKADGPFNLLNNRVTRTGDGIDSTNARGAVIRNNVFEANSDDGIDFDKASDGIIEGNTIRSNGDDGIEIRLHNFSGPALEIVIRNNVIQNNREDGIQLIDYSGLSARTFRIEGNLITGSAKVGLGLMADGNTSENFSGASIPEPISTYGNTFVNNPASITGGDNMTVRNNIFAGSTQVGLKNVDASSSVAYNLFWNNAVNYQSSNVDSATTIVADPRFDPSYHLLPGSPAIDAGVNVGRPYEGSAPDLGAFETAPPPPSP